MIKKSNSFDQCGLCGIKLPKLSPSLEKRSKTRFCTKEHYWASLKVIREKRNCRTCGDEFQTTSTENKRYCSSKCHKSRVTYVDVSCGFCGDSLRVPKDDEFKNKFCSGRCFQNSRSTPKIILKKCEICKSEFVSSKKGGGKRTCSRSCATRLNDPLYFIEMRAALRDSNTKEFLAVVKRYSVITEAKCWEPKFGSSNPKGYPAFSHDGSQTLHRVIAKLVYGAPDDFGQSHHKCSNVKCVNPEHLQWVTPQDNTAEMLSRKAMERKIMELQKRVSQLEFQLEEANNKIF